MENSYMNLIQEKDDKIHILEMQVSQLGNKNSQNRNELSKENAKLMYEIKKLKEQRYTMNNKISLDNASYQSNQELQNMYNIFQDNVKQFRDSVNKLSQDKENLFKTQFIEKLKEDAESKTRNWGKEISDMIEKEFERIQSDYEITIDKLKKENDRLEKENIFLKENNKNTVNVQPSNNTQILKQNLKEVMAISKSKETIIKTQADTLKIKEEEIEKLKKIKSDLEVKLGETKSKYNMKEVEIEDVYSMIEAILTKKKDKYESHYGVVSKETQQRFNEFKKKYKFKLS
jgi:chromosome segregation ATPase